MKIRRWGLAIAAALVSTAVLTGTAANATLPVPDGGGISALRQATVDRAQAALVNGQQYRLTTGGTTYTSTPNKAAGWNYLGRDNSNANINEYTGFRVEEWCGDFAAAMWTGHNRPDPANFPRIPDAYASSQQWRLGVGSEFHAYSSGTLPGPGDVLVWTNVGDSAHGHVGVVVAVNYSTKVVTTIEGNRVDGNGHKDSIVRDTYSWTGSGPALSGKTFRGFTARD